MTLSVQFFSLMVVVVALMKLVAGLEAFMTSGAPYLPPCENINDTVRL
jgi:hypothetical protein